MFSMPDVGHEVTDQYSVRTTGKMTEIVNLIVKYLIFSDFIFIIYFYMAEFTSIQFSIV